jgi:hypothetical protein
MKHTEIILLLLVILLSCGCTSYFSNLQTPQKTLDIQDSAIFTQEQTKFTATVNSVALSQKSSFPRQFTMKMTVKNSGDESFSLIGYPRLVDANGKEYTGTSIMFNTIHPGGVASGSGTMQIKSADDFAALEKSALLRVKYQSMKPLPYEGIWAVDFSTL